MQNGQSIVTVADKTKFLQGLMRGSKDPSVIFGEVMREYRVYGDDAKPTVEQTDENSP